MSLQKTSREVLDQSWRCMAGWMPYQQADLAVKSIDRHASLHVHGPGEVEGRGEQCLLVLEIKRSRPWPP